MVIARSGDDGVEAINNLDKDSVDDLLSLRAACSGPGLFAAQSSGCLDDETIERAVRSVVKATDDGQVSNKEIDDAIQRIDAMDGTNQNQAIRLLADADSDGIKIINYFDDDPDLDANDLSKLVRYTDEIKAVHRSDGTMTVKAEEYGIDVEAKYQQDGEHYLRTEGSVGDRDLADLSNQERGDIVEDEIAPDLMNERGYVEVEGFNKDASNEIGIDYIAKDPKTDEYVLVEAKFTSQFGDKNIGSGILDEGYGYKQMSDRWVEEALDEMERKGIVDSATADKIESDLLRNDREVKKVLTVVKNTNRDGRTITRNLGSEKLDFDHIDVIQIGETIK